MTQFELIAIEPASNQDTITIQNYELPEIVHLDDPAYSVMHDYSKKTPITIDHQENIDSAFHDMRIHNLHIMLVVKDNNQAIGIISSEDIQGEKPIKIIQNRRIQREAIKVTMIMTPISQLIKVNFEDIQHNRVGNVITTLKEYNNHYAAVISKDPSNNSDILRGLFDLSQICRQLHKDISTFL